MKYVWLILALIFFGRGIYSLLLVFSGVMYAPSSSGIGYYLGYIGAAIGSGIFFSWLSWRGFKKKNK